MPADVPTGMVLLCPDPAGCPARFEVSVEDPDGTLSDVVHHLTGHPHYHPLDEAMRLLAAVREA